MLGSPRAARSGSGVWSRVVPKGTSQRTRPLARSTASEACPRAAACTGRRTARPAPPARRGRACPPGRRRGAPGRGSARDRSGASRGHQGDRLTRSGSAFMTASRRPGSKRDAAPVHAARVPGYRSAAPQARRREHPLVAERRELLAADAAIPGREAEGVARADARRVERRREGREGLRRRRRARRARRSRAPGAPPPGRAARPSRDRAGRGGRPSSPGAAPARARPSRSISRSVGCARDVVVPEIVVHGLEAPDHAARRRLEGDDRAPVVVDARALAAEEVRARVPGRHEQQAARRVRREGRPGVGRAALPARRARRPVGERRACPGGTGSKAQRSAPLRASKPRTTPPGASRRRLSSTRAPTATTSPTTVGGEVTRVLAGPHVADAGAQVDRAGAAEVRAGRARARRRGRAGAPSIVPANTRRARRSRPLRRALAPERDPSTRRGVGCPGQVRDARRSASARRRSRRRRRRRGCPACSR